MALTHVVILLLVATVIVALALVALTLMTTTIRTAGESQSNRVCADNLRTLGAAFHMYHSAYGFLPPGEGGHTNGVFGRIEPFLEHYGYTPTVAGVVPGWLDANVRAGEGEPWMNIPEAMKIAEQRIDEFVCPGAPGALHQAPQSLAYIRYAAETSPWTDHDVVQSSALGLNTYASSAGVTGHTGWETFEHVGRADLGDWREGIFTANSRHTFPAIIDGTSNTIALGEYLGNYDETQRAWTIKGAWIGVPSVSSQKTPAESTAAAQWDRFSSPHHGVVNFVMGDGSVRSLRTTIEADAFRGICGMRDGAILDLDELGDLIQDSGKRPERDYWK